MTPKQPQCRISRCRAFPSKMVLEVGFCPAHGTIIETLLTEALVIFIERLGAMCNDIDAVTEDESRPASNGMCKGARRGRDS